MSVIWGQPLITSPVPVTSSWQLAQFAEWIDRQFSQPRGGVTKQMESEWHLWQYILKAGDKPTVLVCANGEKPRTFGSRQETNRIGRVDRSWLVALIRGHGFDTVLQTEKGVPAGKEMLTDSIEALRDVVRALAGVSEEFPLDYQGWVPIPAVARPGTANVFVCGALMTFGTANDIPEVSRTAVVQPVV